jgi:hypothetical protein
VALRGEQNIVQFYITVKYIFLVTITKASHYLPKQMPCSVFLELSALTHVGKQVTSATDFHNEHDMLWCLERIVESNYVLLSAASQNIELLHYFALARFFIHKLLVDRF